MVISTQVKTIAATISSCIVILSTAGYFLKPIFEKEVKKVTKDYMSSPTFEKELDKVVFDYTDSAEYQKKQKEAFIKFTRTSDFEKELNKYLQRNNEETNNVSLRKLLSIRMGCTPEEVAEKLAEMYTKDRKRLINLLRAVNEQYPEYNVWIIN